MSPFVAILVALAAAGGLDFPARDEPQSAPVLSLYCWSGPERACWYYTIGTDAEDARPMEHWWDPFAGPGEGRAWGLTLDYEIPIAELERRARQRPIEPLDPLPCFPGEWSPEP